MKIDATMNAVALLTDTLLLANSHRQLVADIGVAPEGGRGGRTRKDQEGSGRTRKDQEGPGRSRKVQEGAE